MPTRKPVEWRVDGNGCHICTSHCVDRFGYPMVGDSGRLRRLHRWVFEREYGPIPQGICVCHSCDNPACINPEHLFLGSHADNMADMIRKGRSHRVQQGEQNGRAKLTDVIVMAIKREAGRTSQGSLARRYGVAQSTVWEVIRGRTWAHVRPESER